MTRRWLSEKRKGPVGISLAAQSPEWPPWPPAQPPPWPPNYYWRIFNSNAPSQPWVPADITVSIPAGPATRASGTGLPTPCHPWVPYTPPAMKTVYGTIVKIRPIVPDTSILELSDADFDLFGNGDVVTIAGTNTPADGRKVTLTKGDTVANTYELALAVASTISNGTISKLVTA